MRKEMILRNTPPEWNVRALTEADFWDYCDTAKIIVREIPLEQPGCRIVHRGQSHIFLSDQLRGVERLHVMYHELGHHWLHPPRVQFFRGWNKKIELEANTVAACALIPRTMLAHYWPSEIIEEFGYPASLIEFRKSLLTYWEI